MSVPWLTRQGESAPHSAGEKLYLFKKAYDEFVSTSTDGFPTQLMITVEKETGVTHSPNFEALLKSHKDAESNGSCKPLCDLIKSQNIQALLQKLSADALQWKEGQAFVDLCVVLAKTDIAFRFAKEHQKQYDILECVANASGNVRSVLHSKAAKLMLGADASNISSVRLTKILFNCVQSEAGQLQLSLAELWSEGYHWDALCLASLLCPQSENTKRMEAALTHFVQPINTGKIHVICDLLELMQKDRRFVGYKDELLEKIDPIHLYRLLKIDIMRNEQGNLSDLQKLTVRTQNSDALHRVVVEALSRSATEDAHAIAADAIRFIKQLPEAYADYFKGTDKVLFEPAVGLIGTVLDGLNLVLHGKACEMFANAKDSNVLQTIQNNWTKFVPEILTASGQLYRAAFGYSANLLLQELETVKKFSKNGVENGLTVTLATKLAGELLNVGTHDPKQKINEAVSNCGLSQETAEKIIIGFLHKTNTSAITSLSGELMHSHATRDANIEDEIEIEITGATTTWGQHLEPGISSIVNSANGKSEHTETALPHNVIPQRPVLSKLQVEERFPKVSDMGDDEFDGRRPQEHKESCAVEKPSELSRASNYAQKGGVLEQLFNSTETGLSLANLAKKASTLPPPADDEVQFNYGGFEDTESVVVQKTPEASRQEQSRSGNSESSFGGWSRGGRTNFDGHRGGGRGGNEGYRGGGGRGNSDGYRNGGRGGNSEGFRGGRGGSSFGDGHRGSFSRGFH